MGNPAPKPNVISPAAADAVRTFVSQRRAAERLDTSEVVTRLLAEGYGTEFPASIRRKWLKTWANQALLRLRKQEWLASPSRGVWAPTGSLRGCEDSRSPAPSAPGQTEVTREPATPSPPESWEGFVQDWIFEHRHKDFGVAEIAVAMVQRGFGTGEIGGRLDSARGLIERELRGLEWEGLVALDRRSEIWQPTELLRSWPAPEEA